MNHNVSAVVLAAGMSRRMGAQKLLLPWRGQTVIEQVVTTLQLAGLGEIVVVTGAQGAEIAHALSRRSVRLVPNPLYSNGEMIDSIRAGLSALVASGAEAAEGGNAPRAALLCLGDQPQMESATVAAVLAAGASGAWARVVIPSYQMRSGHPILLPATIWSAVMTTTTLRDVLQARQDKTQYLTVTTPTVLADLDTPEDYRRATGHEQQSKAFD